MTHDEIEAFASLDVAREAGYHYCYGPVDVTFESVPSKHPTTKLGAFVRGMYEGHRDWRADMKWFEAFRREGRTVPPSEEARYLDLANLRATLPEPSEPTEADPEEVLAVLRDLGVLVEASALDYEPEEPDS